jgi:hypothetical protein
VPFLLFDYNINVLRELYIISLTRRHAVALGQTPLRSIRVRRRDAHLQSDHLQRLQRLCRLQYGPHLQWLPLRRLRARTYTLLNISLCIFLHAALQPFEANSTAQKPPLPRRRSRAMHPFAEVSREDISFITYISVAVRVLFYSCASAPCVLVLVRLKLQGCSCIRSLCVSGDVQCY